MVSLVTRRGGAHATFFLVSLSRECRLQLRFLARRDEERMFLRVLNYLFGHNLALEAPQRTLNGFTLVYSNYRHSISVFLSNLN
jgi:hypothetical protein